MGIGTVSATAGVLHARRQASELAKALRKIPQPLLAESLPIPPNSGGCKAHTPAGASRPAAPAVHVAAAGAAMRALGLVCL